MATPDRTNTPVRVRSDASSTMPSQVDIYESEFEEEVFNNEARRTRDYEMTAIEYCSSGNDVLSGESTVPIESQEEFLKRIQDNISGLFHEFSFVMSRVSIDGAQLPVLMITPLQVFVHLPLGIMPRIQVSVHYKVYSVHVFMRFWKKESFDTVEAIISLCKTIGEKSEYKFCPGIQYDQYMNDYYEVIRFHIKSVHLTEFPFKRIDSVNCKLLFQLAHNATAEEKSLKEVKCYPCKRLVFDLEHQKRRTALETPTRKVKRQHPSSRARMSYMSPASQAKRRKLAQYERTSNIRKLAQYEENEIVLDDEQNDEMCAFVEKMRDKELQKLFDEGDKHGVGGILKDIWATDLERQQKEFAHDQATNRKINTVKAMVSSFFVIGNGGRGNRWNMITIRMGKCTVRCEWCILCLFAALAIYCRSPAAYKALKEFNILSLPSKSTLQSYSGVFIHAPGVSSACIADQVARCGI